MSTVESRSPQDPEDLVLRAEEAGTEEVLGALERGRKAAVEWTRMPAPSRANALSTAAETLASATGPLTDLVVREVGKPRAEAAGEVSRAVAIWRYYAQSLLDPDGETYPAPAGARLLYHRRRPHGVAGLLTPWNFPIAIPSWKAAPAIAYGNAVVLKPAPEAPAVALALAEHVSRSLPDGLFQVVLGDVDAGQTLVAHADAISFTGSVGAGNLVRRAAVDRGIPVQAEMGGQNASIVLPDADLELAAEAIAQAAMGYAGQKCTATSRVIVVGDPRPVRDALVAAVEALPIGDPAHATTVVGPVISTEARQAVLDAASEAVRDGGQVLTGGKPSGPGWTVTPTLLDGLDPAHRLAQEEVFGPLCVLLPVADERSAVEVANGVRYGLASAVFTRDLDRALAVVDALDTGLVKVNASTSGVDFYAPFGGQKASSYGPREQGKAAREFYTWTQTVSVAATERER